MHPGVAIFLIAILTMVWVLPRQWALLAVVSGALYTTQGQAIDIGGFNLFTTRFIELAAFIRVAIRRELTYSDIGALDRVALIFFAFVPLAFLTHGETGIAYQIGQSVDGTLTYFSFRGLIRGYDDLNSSLRVFAFILVPYVLLLAVERATGHNAFAFMGGPTEGQYIRGDRPRCFGSFRHPSLLGSLGATFLPLYIGAAASNVRRPTALLGISLCALIIFFSNSGGPLNAAAVSILAWCCWRIRTRMRTVRWGILVVLTLLAVMMKSPIWYLPAKVSAFTGGGGYHRSYLIEMAANSIKQWWLLGMPLEQTKDWFPYVVEATSAADITNQFLVFGLRGGLPAMALFVLLLVRAFSGLGNAMSMLRDDRNQDSNTELLLWGLGAALTSHVVNWFGISYFDQFSMFFWLQLAAIAALTGPEHNHTRFAGLEIRDLGHTELGSAAI